MKWFYNMKISVKLLAGFILVALIAGSIGVLGVININTVNNLDNQMYVKMTVPLGTLVDLTNSYQVIRSRIRDMVLSNNTDEMAKYESDINTASTEFDKDLTTFSETILTDAGKQQVKIATDSKAKYMDCANQMIQLAKNNKDQEAITILRGNDMTTAYNNMDAALKELTRLKTSLAKSNADNNSRTAQTSTTTTVIILIAGMIIAVILGVFISTIISRPVNKLMRVAETIAEGDLNVNVDINSKDEIGSLASAFRKMVDNLNEVMSNINTAAEQVATGAKQVSDSSMGLSQGATEQASSVEQLTASLEEISSQTKQNADNANQANMLAENMKTNAMQGNIQMKEMLKSMDEINESSSKISKIIKVIDEIAFQTNILALNAAVEAARAGQHGKGFAVVAEEVRNLAARSANAAKETTDMIEGSIKKVEGGTKIANETATALNKIVEGIAKVAGLVSDIAVSSNEQASGIAQVNQGIMQVSQVVQTNSATSEESAAASEELSSQADLMKEQVSKFTLRKVNRDTASLRELEELNPDVLRILDNMNSQNRKTSSKDFFTKAAVTNGRKISLSDREFGKY